MCIVRKFCQPTHTHRHTSARLLMQMRRLRRLWIVLWRRCAQHHWSGARCGSNVPASFVWLRTVFRPGVPRSWSTMERPCTKAPGICFHGFFSGTIWLWIKTTTHGQQSCRQLQYIDSTWLNILVLCWWPFSACSPELPCLFLPTPILSRVSGHDRQLRLECT